MKSILSVLFLALLIMSFGCSKKEPVGPETAPIQAPETKAEAQSAAEAAQETAGAVAGEIKKIASEVDLNKSLEAIKQEVSAMTPEQLKETALKYKQMLTEKGTAFEAVTQKLAAIPLKDRLSPESQALSGELKGLTDTIKALTERLAVYVSALKAKGGDTTGLTP
ncbi:MAG: hypothetical protein LLF76_00085 [Planctomycetaceae bacterium]|nr:hypothetical protein [Planctomycetaceae bacterium]